MWRRVADTLRPPWYWICVKNIIHSRATRKLPHAPRSKLAEWADSVAERERERFELRLSTGMMV